MFYIITSVVISITAFSTMNEPMKNRKKTELNHGNTIYQSVFNLESHKLEETTLFGFMMK